MLSPSNRSDRVDLTDFGSVSAYLARKVEPEGECWRWKGALLASGYAQVTLAGGREVAHRLAYRTYRGEIPEGLFLDHLCRNKACINPWHLEPVTQTENTRRWARTITSCPQGHDYDEANTYVTPAGGRACRKCHLNRELERKAVQRAVSV